MKKIFFALAALAIAAPTTLSANESALGYCTGTLDRGNIFRMGSSEQQGMAIKLSAGKCALLRGATITGVRAGFGSKRTTDSEVRVFISTSPEATPITENTATISSVVKWIDLPFNTPYTITGEEECLFIGYTAEIDPNVSMLLSDKQVPVSDASFIYYDGEWHSTENLACGNVSLRAIVQDAPEITDLLLKPVAADGYFKAGDDYTLSAQVLNFGNQPVSAFTYSLQVGDSPAQVAEVTVPALAPGDVYTFDLPDMRAAEEGYQQLLVNVGNVNGAADSEPSDNVFESPVFYYPAAMERSFLLEGFTGQTCSNCPAGHSTINTFLEGIPEGEIVEMMHHSGYNPDFFTTVADADLTLFFGPGSTYAPAFMLNRTVFPQLNTVPANFVSAASLGEAYTALQQAQPCFSMAIESTYNPDTRKLDVKLRTRAHVVPEAGTVVVNIALVQDGIVSMQTPYGANYTHNRVHRAMLTGNTWGITLPASALAEGAEWEWSTEYTLPEAIFSDYWSTDMDESLFSLYNIATDPANMSLIAYIAEFSATDLSANRVLNTVETKLGASHVQGGMAGINSVEADRGDAPAIAIVNGRVAVEGEHNGLLVYTADGRAVNPASTLTPGVYIVRVAYLGGVAVKKISIR